MNLLLDTHAFLWWIAGDAGLSLPARHAIDDTSNAIFVSAATAWEIAAKVRIGKLLGRRRDRCRPPGGSGLAGF